MQVTVDLAGLVNAELISNDGIPGVFIPFEPNCTVKYDKSGRHAYVAFRLWPARPNKQYSHTGTQIIPQKYADKFLSDPRYAGKQERVAYLWSGDGDRESGGLVTEADFEKIVGGR